MIALFFDTETTGFKSSTFTPEIVQIGALVQDTVTKRVLAELNVIVKNKEPIPEVVSKIHGITDELATKFGVEGELAEGLFMLMVQMADVVVAHNIEFDLDIIRGAWPASAAFLYTRDQFCTMKQSKNIARLKGTHGKGFKYPRLSEAYQHFFGTDFDNAHDAMADVRACRDIYFKLQGI